VKYKTRFWIALSWVIFLADTFVIYSILHPAMWKTLGILVVVLVVVLTVWSFLEIIIGLNDA
jgi:uncharacterized membrane protein